MQAILSAMQLISHTVTILSQEFFLGSCADPKALGMQNGAIPGSAITASSSFNKYHKPSYARLNKKKILFSWTPKCLTLPDIWHQAYLGKPTIVTAIATQGSCYITDRWVISYTVAYSTDGTTWTDYEESGKAKVSQRIKRIIFIANTKGTSSYEQIFC